ncbi:hypothetical protein ACWFRF_00855 [Nocardia sp. NPDC055165]
MCEDSGSVCHRRNPGGGEPDAHRDYLGSGVGVVGVRFDATFMVCE